MTNTIESKKEQHQKRIPIQRNNKYLNICI